MVGTELTTVGSTALATPASSLPAKAGVSGSPEVAVPALVEARKDSTRFPRIKSILPAEAIAQLKAIISTAYIRCGRTLDPAEIDAFVGVLYEDILVGDYGVDNISVYEINWAIRNAILHDKIFLSEQNIFNALVSYAKGAGNIADNEARRQKKEADQRLLDESGYTAMLTAYAGEMSRR